MTSSAKIDRVEPDPAGSQTLSDFACAAYSELRRIAGHYFKREAKGHTHNRPGQRPGKKQRIFSEGQRPVSYLISKSYIDTQEEHHLTKTFQEEYRELLGKYHIEFDERYLGD